jgi:3-deoxy-manno-octulosonate cytidylyltransferase (CMP-KDO synthetase)
MRIVGVIPARLHSTRLPRKVLQDVCGKPLVWHVFQSAQKAKRLDGLVVAADHPEIIEALQPLEIPVLLTSDKHQSGTERVGEIAAKMPADAYINIQGDEPMIAPANIDLLAKKLESDSHVGIVTLKSLLARREEIMDPNNVKVVTDRNGKALYFSRYPIPFDREGKMKGIRFFKHIGLYGYRSKVLQTIIRMKPSSLEKAEKLEQLRFMENGLDIFVLETRFGSIGVDTEEDLRKVRELMGRRRRLPCR